MKPASGNQSARFEFTYFHVQIALLPTPNSWHQICSGKGGVSFDRVEVNS